MKSFLIKTATFVALLWAVDAAVGVGCRFFQGRAKGGETGRINYITDRMEEELLVFGSSRAIGHYDPRILADSVGLSCYNCGQVGNGIIFSYGQYRLFRDRYVPRVIVYDIHPPFDLSERDPDEKYLEWLRCFYDREGIDSIFWDVDATERWKMLSMMRRYNWRFRKLVTDAYHPSVEYGNGYYPYVDTTFFEYYKDVIAAPSDLRVDTLKMKYWRKLVADCKARGTRLVFVVSPLYTRTGGFPEFEPLRELARQEGIPLLWHADDTAFAGKKQYFCDHLHLKKKGAEAYSKVVASELKRLLSQREGEQGLSGGPSVPKR